MALIQLTELEPSGAGTEVDFWLDAPKVGHAESYAIAFEGWVVGSHQAAEAIELTVRGDCRWRLPLNVNRPDVASIHSDLPWSGRSGFSHSISALKLPRQFELEVLVVLADGTRVRLATIRGERSPLEVPASRVEPIMVTTLGRTGSTWVLTLLGAHPDVTVFRPFEYETKLVRYWTDVFGALSEPASYRQPLGAEVHGDDWWLGSHRQSPPADRYDAGMEEWLGGRNVEQLASFCKQSIDAFYEQAATLQGKGRPSHFAEKGLPGTFREQILPELYPGALEVFLVRDFRDMASSILAFDQKLGYNGFGHAGEETAEQFVRGHLTRDVDLLAESWRRRSGASLLLRYEDLVRDPRATLASLLSGLGLDSEGDVVDETMRIAHDTLPGRQSGHRTSSSAEASIGRWRAEAPPVRAACEESFAQALELFGYSV